MKVVRVYTGDDGASHFQDLEIELEDHVGRLSALWPGKGILFRAVDGEPRRCVFVPLDDPD